MISEDYLLNLKSAMIADYNRPSLPDWMRDEYAKSFKFVFGKKYIKIVVRGSCSGFIVNTDNDPDFQLGTLLKAASWAAPARNFSRGSIFDSADVAKVSWTGVN